MNRTESVQLTVFERIVGIVWRSIVVGLAYTLTTFFLGAFMAGRGIPFPNMGQLGFSKPWFLGASILMGFVTGGISQVVHTSKLNHFMTWTILLFLNPFSVTLESSFLAPQLLTVVTIPALMLVQFISAAVASLLITLLFASASPQPFGPYFRRPWSAWIMRFVVCVSITLLLYSLLSATNYPLITKLYRNYYHLKLAIPNAGVIFAIELFRAFLIVLSLLPMVITIGATKRFIAVISGITLVVLGALSPFLQVSNLAMFLLLASSEKIFIQNFMIGLIVGFILGYPSKLEVEGTSMIGYLQPILREALNNTAKYYKESWRVISFKKPITKTAAKEDPQPRSK